MDGCLSVSVSVYVCVCLSFILYFGSPNVNLLKMLLKFHIFLPFSPLFVGIMLPLSCFLPNFRSGNRSGFHLFFSCYFRSRFPCRSV